MASTSARTLRLLSLLQHHRFWTGRELAERLEVSERTLRRDVDRLRDLGYPVSSVRGVDGGYQLDASATLPPLVLDPDEAVALAVGLHTAAFAGPTEVAESSVRALAKVVALLPPRARLRADAVRQMTEAAPGRWSEPGPSPDVLGEVAQACRDGVRLDFEYVARDGVHSRRYVEPYRMVTVRRRWYLVAFDVDRRDWRTFRLDRIAEVRAARVPFDPRPLPADDLAAFVGQRIEQLTAAHHVVVLIDAAVDDVRQRIGRWGDAEPVAPGRTRLTMDADSLDWPIALLAWLDADVEVVEPAELRDRLAAIASRWRSNGGD